jgi:hypothetical protein
MTLAMGVATETSAAMFGADSFLVSFSVQSATKCTTDTCPGSFYTAITTAWANIGYVTHADVLRFLNTSNFGKWAILLYIAAAITGLLGVATNSPMRNYTWFFIGPALFSFLVGTTTQVQGVNWVVANRAAEDMSEVWKNAEAGLANTRLVEDKKLSINGKFGPTGQYEVAMPMVFLDELFSATANILIEWTGIGRQVDNGGGESNLAGLKTSVSTGKKNEAWWLLANLKWSYVENITAATIRNPDVRDAFITFLASECGDNFKQGIDSGAYIAATQARGATPVDSVFNNNENKDYTKMQELLGGISIPTPRSLGRLFKEKGETSAPGTYIRSGSFRNFSPILADTPEKTGRGVGIVCSEYLWTIIQALRFEAGNAYYQMLRSAPNGFEEEGFVTTLLYGWDVREKLGEDIQEEQQKAFLKHLILAYIVRNELIAAPQLTTVDQRYAPAEQSRGYSEANIRSYGSKAKFIELYNAAVMMPYLQGILAYFLIVAYPIACMMVILPGHYKAFFTWVSFFAWIKLWDVGFAMVHVIERSVWAMIGNNSYMGGTARTLIEVAKKVGGIGVRPQYDSTFVGPVNGNLEALNAIPIVCSLGKNTLEGDCLGSGAVDQDIKEAFELFDKLLVVGSNIDLDLSNGWYIYIMSALYLAVPAVTGQLVLGAKAGSAGLIKDAFSSVGNDGAQAAKTGAQHAAVNALTTNQKSLGQAAMAKAMRGTNPQTGKSFAMSAFGATNEGLNEGLAATKEGLEAGFLNAQSQVAGKSLESFDRAKNLASRAGGFITSRLPGQTKDSGDGSGGKVPSGWGKGVNAVEGVAGVGGDMGRVALGRRADIMGVGAAAEGQRLAYSKEGRGIASSGLRDYGGKLGSHAEFEAQSAAWEAKNEFAAHASAMAGIAGMNAGSLAPGEKPSDMTQMTMGGMLESYSGGGFNSAPTHNQGKENSAFDAATYAGTGYVDAGRAIQAQGQSQAAAVQNTWQEAGGSFTATSAASYAARESTLNPGANLGAGWEQISKTTDSDGKPLTAGNSENALHFGNEDQSGKDWTNRTVDRTGRIGESAPRDTKPTNPIK